MGEQPEGERLGTHRGDDRGKILNVRISDTLRELLVDAADAAGVVRAVFVRDAIEAAARRELAERDARKRRKVGRVMPAVRTGRRILTGACQHPVQSRERTQNGWLCRACGVKASRIS